jgi:hypothetical protein
LKIRNKIWLQLPSSSKLLLFNIGNPKQDLATVAIYKQAVAVHHWKSKSKIWPQLPSSSKLLLFII